MAKTPSDGMVSSPELSKYIGLQLSRIQELVRMGVIPAERRGNRLRFDLPKAVRAYIDYLKKSVENKTTDEQSLSTQKLRAEVDYKRANADQAELKLQEIRGELHRSEDVEAAMNGLVYAVRDGLVAVPPRLATDVVKCKTKNEATKVIKREMYRLLEEFEHYRYDPDFFDDRVRERQGWGERP